jgi:hypothetical protein
VAAIYGKLFFNGEYLSKGEDKYDYDSLIPPCMRNEHTWFISNIAVNMYSDKIFSYATAKAVAPTEGGLIDLESNEPVLPVPMFGSADDEEVGALPAPLAPRACSPPHPRTPSLPFLGDGRLIYPTRWHYAAQVWGSSGAGREALLHARADELPWDVVDKIGEFLTAPCLEALAKVVAAAARPKARLTLARRRARALARAKRHPGSRHRTRGAAGAAATAAREGGERVVL